MSVSKLFPLIAIPFVIASCKGGAEFEKTESGLQYKIYHHEEGSVLVKEGDFLTVDLKIKSEKDSLVYSSVEAGQPEIFKLMGSQYKGDIYEGLRQLSLGDSATFLINADSFFHYSNNQRPDFIAAGSHLKFDIALRKIQSEEEITSEAKRKMEELKNLEAVRLDEYLKVNNVSVAPTNSGLYYVELTKGKGKKPQAGKSVKVHYTGMFMDGSVFDSSVERGEPIEFVLGTGNVIRGWDEGINMMAVGGKATLVIPSHIAYGDNGRGRIPPFSTLVFNVELVDAN